MKSHQRKNSAWRERGQTIQPTSDAVDKTGGQHLQDLLPSLILAIVIAAALWATTREWDKPLLDMHSFRQTQTAVSAYYMAKDPWIFLSYITPVLGKPWQIPLEVPFYQWIVARWHNISGMGLDQSGKLVSIAFWLACLWPVWCLLGLLNFSLPQRCVTCSIIYSSPLYLYWGRAFMMESTGVFLSLGMVACIFAGYQRRDWRWMLCGLAFGLSAALCKVTTWALAVGVVGLLILFSDGLPKWRDWKWLAFAAITAVFPIIPAKLWLLHGDKIKQQNPFARELIMSVSKNQSDWNFGTLQQKLDPATWEHIWRHITDQLLVPFPIIGPFLFAFILVGGAISSPKRIRLLLIFLAGFASGPVIFTNLYFEHSYYWCANGIWLLLSVGTALVGISEYRQRQYFPGMLSALFAIIILISGLLVWAQRFLPILKALPTQQQFDAAWRNPAQAFVPPERTILIVGNDWNPNSLYYAERKGIAFPIFPSIQFPGAELEESLSKLDPAEALGAVVINERLIPPENQPALARILEKFGMSTQGTRTPFGVLFPARDVFLQKPQKNTNEKFPIL